MKIYLVGGAVRDQLLGIPPRERDWLVVGASAEQMGDEGFRPVGKDFPVFLHPKTQEEYALARTERKSGKGYKGFTFHTATDITVEQDLLRRDLTINAIAQDPESKQLIDPYAGQADIRARLLRHVSPSFAEDPLRVLRVARFAAQFHHLGFSIHPDTLELMSQLANSGELATLTAERIWQEMNKALHSRSPAIFFETLVRCNGLEAISPELALLFNSPSTPSNSEAINQSLCTESTALRYAQLWHNASTVELADKATIKRCSAALTVPKSHSQLASAVALYQHLFHSAQSRSGAELLILFNDLNSWRSPQLTEDFIDVCTIRGKLINADLLRHCYKRATDIDIAALQTQGYAGAQLGEAITNERLGKITAALGEL